tara:strand:- start:741 stop:3989 length:3249 start_codon:yes stop_codon:yes gene_type:complete
MKSVEATTLLDKAYEDLGYAQVKGISFFDAKDKPGDLSENDWIEKGDWLVLANKAGASKVFFLDNNPVAVFARSDADNPKTHLKLYNSIWSMARPRFLFFAKPGELVVYDLAKKPPKSIEEFGKLESFEIARSIAEVAEKLKHFRREELESGRVFEMEYRFGSLKDRADKALIKDLKEVRRELIKKGLSSEKIKYAHALIGRSVFIRYLEDRDILTNKTFYEVAEKNTRWKRILDEPPNRQGLDFSEKPSLYGRVLENKDFSYALFRKLANDFNGDMFPDVDREEEVVKPTHLRLIQDLLFGDTGRQKSLFFYAYQFNIIPIELISSIYEEFYHEESEGGQKYGAFYTPSALVEFVLTQTLTPERLATSPCILDPACGSGIFLVESFRRIVRYRIVQQRGRRLSFDQLQKILRDQLRGIEIYPEAVRVAAFSLYLALLHYLKPPDIHEQIEKGNQLPNLVVDDDNPDSFATILSANAFNAKVIESQATLKERFSSSCADIVVGNPPWGSPGPKDIKAREQNKIAMEWCEEKGFPVGNKERSQAFIWRALDMLKSGGIAGMLVHTGVFLKHHEKSVAFRRKWLNSCTLGSVFNFAHTRHVFFKKGVNSPFAAVTFSKIIERNLNQCVHYWSSKSTLSIERLQSVVFSKNDVKLLRHEDDLSNYQTWKTFLWGNHRDRNLINYLQNNESLGSFTNQVKAGRGYQKGNKKYKANWLKLYKLLPIKSFDRYGPLDLDKLEDVPVNVESRGVRDVYYGLRLLVQCGIHQKSIPKGQIIARLEEKEFCFTNDIHGVKLPEIQKWEYQVILGILWSSLARYYFFLTTANWGIWHYEIHLRDELLSLPVRFPKKTSIKNRIIKLVEELSSYDPPVRDSFNLSGVSENEIPRNRQKFEAQLDEAIFELYGLGEAEIDLVRDMCDTNLDFYYLKDKSNAVTPVITPTLKKKYGTIRNLPKDTIGDYLRIFIKSWSTYLDNGTEFHWRLCLPPESSSMVAVIFSIRGIQEEIIRDISGERETWINILHRLDKALLKPMSSRVYIDGLVRAVTEDEVMIIKRNEKRFFTKSMAREDAEATLMQAMNRDKMGKGK